MKEIEKINGGVVLGSVQNIEKQPIVHDAFYTDRINIDSIKVNDGVIGDLLYIAVRTTGLENKEINANVIDKDGILTGKEYTALNVTQGKSSTLLKAKVRNDGWAFFKFKIQPKSDTDKNKWVKNLKQSKDQKAYLSILIDAHSSTKVNVIYQGINFGANKKDSEHRNVPNYWLGTKEQSFKLKRKIPVIVIDPGHGVDPGNKGAQARIYLYQRSNKDENFFKDDTGRADIMNLPKYVLEDPKKWIIGNNDSKNHNLDNDRTESKLVYDISLEIVKLLKNKGYKVINTRKTSKIVKVSDEDESKNYRIKIANDNEADYFISIHADGLNDFTSGCNAIYFKGDEISKELAQDVFSNYTVIQKSKKHPEERNDIRVIGEKNYTKRKVLIELGFITNPNDANKIYNNKVLIAEQLVQGLEVNINKYF